MFEVDQAILVKNKVKVSLLTNLDLNTKHLGQINLIVDSSATGHLLQKSLQEHMTQVESLKSPITIKIANGVHLTNNSKCVICFKCADRNVTVDALFVKGLSHNL
ncbi:hypothetical protein PR048_005605 [Dryococelus australis]|uniref:Uncharacterized protein n=1 Tax=Dryococelus australis TaxID=614101 RepID=A0ABQ9I8P0_9NEOP|nr:hypothetical protein PR048_005605 [Dryococelus australis]